jgi:hypothetical protein
MAEPADRRASDRMPVNPGTTCFFVARVVDDLGPVKIRDISMHGVGLVVTRSVQVGAVLAIGLANPSKGFSKTMMVQVAHVTPIPGGFLVGGAFTDPLTYQEFTTFVI